MDEEDQLRDRLAAVDVPPSRIEVAALLGAGRRAAFRRRSLRASGGVALATAALLAVPPVLTGGTGRPADRSALGPTATTPAATTPARATPPATPATKAGPTAGCRPAELPVPPGTRNVEPAAVDPTGRYVVGNGTVGQDFRPVLWTDGKPRALPVPGTSVQATAVNAGGVVVGLVQNGRQEYVARYADGVWTRLRTPPGKWHPYPTPKINRAGDVVINVEPSGNSGGEGSIALLWKAGSTTAVRLPLPAGANVHAITDDGTLVGGTYVDGVGTAAYAWNQRGVGRKLPVPAGQTGLAYAARGDWVTGGAWPSESVARWNLRTGQVIVGPRWTHGTGSQPYGPGTAVNASGWVVALGTVLRAGKPVELTLPDGRTGRASDVSDDGLVVGSAFSDPGSRHLGPRVWRC
ncbi:hypothetical protein [Micromonospora mirobrigensis]|uniref:Uncharacterized protein n=1 Tax=Micromonospora mirobrigensis TaxID=262898 RepID=A0A1C4XIN0_9ACTN|nr:hypothetical protein [Micromonospora mirobrigensis]SCF08162.1 hypothetical protein GA0070564_103114 [Micromonospora mirobrigensis]